MYYFFDFHGAYLGYMDPAGRFFDPAGEEWARLERDGQVVDQEGAVRGIVDAQGCYFEASGGCRGYLRDPFANPPPLEVM